ncbi:MAG: hypothetical protein DWQ02_08000 [Bacteroidetes bacterium]|nr:MAG: hypothetical protein DWQ02_08000 [Bacteroidota bacterium]
MRYTRNNLKKLETLFGELEYTIRYEKGNFQSGYCIVEDRKIAVVNKFFDTEARMNVLFDILSKIEIEEKALSEDSLKLLKDINKHTAKKESETNPADEN